ncbi:MAG: 2TM domain-containing protein [Candidatus Bathyarchaeota archaeon]|nr:2TM domain-containing protein [Candidatus Bathyarchaeota archaeon]
MSNEEALRRKARARAEAKIGFYVNLAVYSVVNVFLILLWWFTGGYRGVFPWFIFPLFGWGIGLLIHYLMVFTRTGVTERLTEQEYRHLKEEQGS